MKRQILNIVTKFNMLDDTPLKAEYSIEDYYDQRFVLHEIGHGRNIIEINLYDVCQIPHLIERITAQDACFMGAVIGEFYAANLDKNITICLPENRLSSTGAQLSLFTYDIDSAMVNYFNKHDNKHEYNYLLNLTRTPHLMSQFSPSHSYQLGFYAGELLHTIKQTIRVHTATNDCEQMRQRIKIELEKS